MHTFIKVQVILCIGVKVIAIYLSSIKRRIPISFYHVIIYRPTNYCLLFTQPYLTLKESFRKKNRNFVFYV